MQTPVTHAPTYFKNLDGFRFIAAAFVIFGHCQSVVKEHLNTNPYSNYADKLASFGVDFFFVLSGFLISYLLFLEHHKTGTIRVRRFYMRRILRLWPLYFIFSYVSILAATEYVYALDLLDRPQYFEEMFTNLAYVTFFSTNFQILNGMNYPGSFTISHFWSLSVEEQFYLIWAPLMYLFRKRVWLLLILVTSIGAFTMVWEPEIYKTWFGSNAGSTTYYATYTRFLYFGSGAFLAFFIHKQEVIKTFLGITDNDLKYLQWGLSIIVVVEGMRYLFMPVYYVYVEERFLNALLSTALVLVAITKHSAINLEFGFLKYLGKISFGIYVFHFLAIRVVWFFLEKQHISEQNTYLLLPILATLLSIIFAALSYEFIEKWFLKQKDKFKF